MVAIVTDVRYRMSLALIRDLGQAGVEVITCEVENHRDSKASPALGALSRCTSRHVWLPEEGYLDALFALCREVGLAKNCRPALLPVGAKTLAAIAGEEKRFAEVCGLTVPTPEQLELMNSKERVAALAERLGIPVPEGFARQKEEQVEDFARRLPLPCVVKPICGERLGLTAADRYAIVKTAGEAAEAFRRFRDLSGEDPVVQTYLPGGGIGCSVLAAKGQVLASICHRRLREYPVSGGPSSCCQCVDRPDLEAYAAKMIGEIGCSGLAMFEFKEDGDGTPRLLEVNPRVWGTFPLTRISGSGISLLWCALAWNAGNPGSPVPMPPARKPLHKRMIFAASDLMAAMGYARRGRPGVVLEAFGDLLNPTVRDGLFEWRDMAPALAYFRSLVTKERHA